MSQNSAESRGSTLRLSHCKQLTMGRLPLPHTKEASQAEGKYSEKRAWGTFLGQAEKECLHPALGCVASIVSGHGDSPYPPKGSRLFVPPPTPWEVVSISFWFILL